MTAFMLKIIAIIAMTLDHSSYLIYGGLSWMNYVGRIAFPIFAYQISEGYLKTHSKRIYAIKLLIFAIISQFPYTWFRLLFFNNIGPNIIFTLLLGLVCIYIYDIWANSIKNFDKSLSFSYKLIGIMIVIFIALLAKRFNFDYGFYGVFLIYLFYIFHSQKSLMNLSVIVLTFIDFLPNLLISAFNCKILLLFLCTLVPLVFINFYNGKKGKNYKFLFYIFYPLHLLVLCLLHFVI